MRFLRVGGCVRDELLGVKPADIDFAVEAESWEAVLDTINSVAVIKHVIRKDFTIKAWHPAFGDVDYVFCRKYRPYSDGRPPNATPGTILDDLERRDFTMNAMAVDPESEELIDPHGGVADLEARRLVCVGDAHDRLMEDPVRVVRGLRFAAKLDLAIDPEFWFAVQNPQLPDRMALATAPETLQRELDKAFRGDTVQMIDLFSKLPPRLKDQIFSGGIWLQPTLKQR